MIYPIVPYGNPILRKRAEEVDKDYPGLQQLIFDMFETMEDACGVGLAAPQIDLSIRVIVIDATPFAEDQPQAAHFKKVLINPEIIDEQGEAWSFSEGCLSFPGLHEDVYRKPRVKIRYQNENLEWKEESYDGYIARVIQHEYDHLEGKVFVDHLSPVRRAMLKRRLDSISKGEVKADYKMKWNLKKKRI